jgi:hypothetical protein
VSLFHFVRKVIALITTVYDLNENFSGGQEVKFHEIQIQLFQEVEFSIMRSKPKKHYYKFLSHDRSCDQQINHEIKTQNKALLGNLDLMIDLLAASAIMRSKVFMHRWPIIRAKN